MKLVKPALWLVSVIVCAYVYFNWAELKGNILGGSDSSVSAEEQALLTTVKELESKFFNLHKSPGYLDPQYVDRVMTNLEGVVLVNRQPMVFNKGIWQTTTSEQFDGIRYTLSYSDLTKLLAVIDAHQFYNESISISTAGSVANVFVRLKEVSA
jgi:hypothetical protein